MCNAVLKPSSKVLINLYESNKAINNEVRLHSRQQARNTRYAERSLELEVNAKQKRPITAKSKPFRSKLMNARSKLYSRY